MHSILLSLAVALLYAHAANAEPVRGIRAAIPDPITPRGSVLMVQLTADRAGDNWPATVSLRTREGAELVGLVAWVESKQPRRERRWTDDPRGLSVRGIEPSDDSSNPALGSPYLLVRVPADITGELKLDRQSLRPVWVDVPEQGAYAQTLERTIGPDRPDADSPFEFWRWVTLAEQLGMNPPSLRGMDEHAAMCAEHLASLWRIALARLDSLDVGLGRRVRALLTRIASDRGVPFAVWVADPAETGGLLSELASTRQSDRVALEFVRLWVEKHDRAIVWPEADYDSTLRLAVIGAGAREQNMTLRWPGSPQTPMRFTVEPNVLMRVLATKPRLVDEAVPAVYGRQPSQAETAAILIGEQEIDLPLRPRRYAATPPAVYLSELAPPLTLAEVQTLRRLPAQQEFATLVSIRKINRRWEVFVDCRRPAGAEVDRRAVELPEQIVSFDGLRGTEAVTILVGPEAMESDPGAIVTIPENGWPRVYLGVRDGSMQVHRRSHGDRWYARIVLPDAWMPNPNLGPVLLGFIRTHGDSQAIETGPNSSVPWRTEPGRVAIDLSEWEGAAGE